MTNKMQWGKKESLYKGRKRRTDWPLARLNCRRWKFSTLSAMHTRRHFRAYKISRKKYTHKNVERKEEEPWRLCALFVFFFSSVSAFFLCSIQENYTRNINLLEKCDITIINSPYTNIAHSIWLFFRRFGSINLDRAPLEYREARNRWRINAPRRNQAFLARAGPFNLKKWSSISLGKVHKINESWRRGGR